MSEANRRIDAVNVAVTTSFAAVGPVIGFPAGAGRATLFITNTGANALTNFGIYRNAAANGAAANWQPYLTGTDFTTATSKLTPSGGADGQAVNTLPAGDTGWIDVDIGVVEQIQLWAQAGTATTITIAGWTLQNG